MANSSVISTAKNKIIKEFIKDDDIVKAIGCADGVSAEELIGKHIFDYHQNPHTLNTVQTFITIQVHIPEPMGYYNTNYTFVHPTVEIWIISHEQHMNVDDVPKVKVNRNDYLSMLIDSKLNGRSDLGGLGKLDLIYNIEGAFQSNYLYRTMLFKGTDLNQSVCKPV